ncbi:hypothetical protein D9611_014839 [Ephemerocybe angulata]|uniref:Uncharacterized protein n=1 Tax=Ephemerocybe angulata TaxID=980116 RepID=A0A8H5BT10_9AGAR|nr:hypothetical protein D9611_014839 [Tulosesus angulatus]
MTSIRPYTTRRPTSPPPSYKPRLHLHHHARAIPLPSPAPLDARDRRRRPRDAEHGRPGVLPLGVPPLAFRATAKTRDYTVEPRFTHTDHLPSSSSTSPPRRSAYDDDEAMAGPGPSPSPHRSNLPTLGMQFGPLVLSGKP